MSRKPILFAGVSAILLAAACGNDEPSDDTPIDTAGIEQTETSSMQEAGDASEDPSPYEASDMTSERSEPMMDDNGSAAPMSGGDGDAPLLDRLEGDWLSGEDDQAEMSIIDGTVTMMYAGEVLTVESLNVVDSCPDAVGEASDELELFTTTSDATGETLCYGVLSLEDDRLELTSYPRGNTLTYTRQPMTDVLDTE